MNDDGARADQSSSMRTALDGPQVRHTMPPATAVRAWHSAGVLWTLNADGMREWRLSRPQRATPPRASAIPHPGIDVIDPSTVAVEDADDCADDSDAADPDAAASLAPIAVEPLHILPTPNECWPLTVLPGLRAVVGVASLPVPSASAPIGPHVHLQPIAHHHVRRRLIEGDTETAFQLARAAPFRRRYCLELLLHEALLEAQGGRTHPTSLGQWRRRCRTDQRGGRGRAGRHGGSGVFSRAGRQRDFRSKRLPLCRRRFARSAARPAGLVPYCLGLRAQD